jgi:hypothetical protein
LNETTQTDSLHFKFIQDVYNAWQKVLLRRLGVTLEKIVFDVKSMPQMENGKWKMGYGKSPSCEQPDPYIFLAARKGHVFGAPSPTTLSPLCGSKREFCSRLARLWWSGRSAHAGKRATERAFHQGYGHLGKS